MLASALTDIIWAGSESPAKKVIDFLGKPAIALLIAVIAGIFILGRGGKMNRDAIAEYPGEVAPADRRHRASSSARAAGSSRC